MSNVSPDARSIIAETERPQSIAPEEIEEERFDDLPEPSHEGAATGFADLDQSDEDAEASRRVPPGEYPKAYPAQSPPAGRN